MRTSPRPSVSDASSKSKYNSKLKSISDFFLDKLPSWRRKSSPSIEPVSSENNDYVLTDVQRKALKDMKENNSYSNASNYNSGNNIPPLLPSLSESKIPSKPGSKAASQHARTARKILVSSSANRTSSESGNVVKISNNNNKLNGHPSPTKSQTRLSYSDYQAGQNTIGSSPSRKSFSNQEYASTSSATPENSVHETPRSAVSNHHSRHTASPSSSNVVIFGNSSSGSTNKTTASRTGTSILGSLGFPSIGGSSKNTITSTSGSSAHNSNVITVKPADYSAYSNTNVSTSAGSAPSSSAYSSATTSASSFNSNYAHTINKSVVTNRDSVTSTTNNTDKLSGSTASTANSTTATTGTAANTTTTAPAKTAAKPLCCDKCDGKHETDNCPYYKKKRDDHPDAQKNKQIGGVSSLPGNTLYSARVVRQPGDGSCLFHSMSYGLPSKSNAAKLRAEICQFIQNNPNLQISDTPLQDWVKWDANSTVGEYARKMSRGSWGGGIEMACVSQVTTLTYKYRIQYLLNSQCL